MNHTRSPRRRRSAAHAACPGRPPTRLRRRTARLGAAAAALALAACGSTATGATSSSGRTTKAAALPACPVSALASAKGPVDITFWESMPQANGTTLAKITNAFNASQSKVHVTLVQQASYDDTWQKYTAGLTNGHLPDVVQLEDVRTQIALDTNSFLPVQSCIAASHYSTSDYVARALDYWKVGGVQWAMPFAVSNPVLYYNKTAFQKAGLNPNDPPTTMAAFLADASALKAAGSGVGLKLDPWHLETWLATANQSFVNNDNGRSARATKVVFDTATGTQIFSDLRQLVTSGEATTNPNSGPSGFDNLAGIGSGKYGMSIDTSAALGTITQVLDSGQYPGVQLGIGPFPALSSVTVGGVEPGGSALYISKRSSPAAQAASWEYIEYLDSTQSQAAWAAGTGYIPVRISSTSTPTIEALWQKYPGYKIAYTQVADGANTPATLGSVIGPYDELRTAVLNAEISMYQGGVSASKALATAAANADQVLSSYNQRLGVS